MFNDNSCAIRIYHVCCDVCCEIIFFSTDKVFHLLTALLPKQQNSMSGFWQLH